MKQKNTPAKPKNTQNGVQKAKNVQQQNVQPAVAAAAASQAVSPVAKGNNKKKATPVKAVPAPKVAVEEDEAAQEEDAPIDEEAEAEEDAEQDEDDEPTEQPIEKTSNAQSNFAALKIKTGDVPVTFVDEQVVFVQNLPRKSTFKQIDLVEVFAKYGAIHTIKPMYKVDGVSTAFVAYNTVEEAKAALAADQADVKGNAIKVSLRKTKASKKEKIAEEKRKQYEEKKKQIEESKDRLIYVKNLKQGTTSEQVQEHFATCGEIDNVNLIERKGFTYAFVVYKEESSVEPAIKMHNSTFNGVTIGVYLHGDESSKANSKDPKRTVFMKNTEQLETFPGEKVTSIFEQCGEIANIDVLCRKNVLAFITFKEEEGAKKALELTGQTIEGVLLEVHDYKPANEMVKTTIFVQNVKPGTSEEKIRELFSQSGEIAHIFMKGGFAIIKYKEVDGFCKSFLLNETVLEGQPIFMEPYSEMKQKVMKKPHNSFGKRKQMPHNKGGNKRFKHNAD